MRALSCIRGNKVFELERVGLLQPRLVCITSLMARWRASMNVKQSTAASAKGAQKSPMFN